MDRAELERVVFQAAGECARTGESVRVREDAHVNAEAFERAFAAWQSLGGRNVEMRLSEMPGGAVVAEFTPPAPERDPTLAEILAARTRHRTRRT